ncbi:Uncharacterised protein [Pasteurella multocida]|nr:Uncharacterised protein [Pasteurella multocida]
MKLEYYLEKIKNPIIDRESLLKVNAIKNIEDIMPLFTQDFIYKEYLYINGLLRQRYLVENHDEMLRDVDMDKISLSKDTRTIHFLGANGPVLDFSQFNCLEKIHIIGSRTVKNIILPKNGCVKALGITNMRALEVIENITLQKEMRYLHFDYSLNITNFDFIKDLNKLVYLSFSNNKKLPEINFIDKESELYFIDFFETNAIKYSSTLDILKRLKNLKFLFISGTKKERLYLKQALPHVCMRDDI